MDDVALAVSVAMSTRLGWSVGRTPLVAEPVQSDWSRSEDMHKAMLEARILQPHHDSGWDSDDFGDGGVRLGEAAEDVPLDVAIFAPDADEMGRYAEERGTMTLFGCRLCTSLVPTIDEAEAFMHVVRLHGKACLPADEEIFAVRCARVDDR